MLGLGLCDNTLTPARTPRLGLCDNTLTPARTPRLGLCDNTLTPARTPRLGLCDNTLTPARTPRLGLCDNTLTPAITTRLGLCHNTLTPATTSRLHWNVVMCCIAMWGLSLSMISSLCNSIHPSETKQNPSKTIRGGTILKQQSHTQSSHPMECICQCTTALNKKWNKDDG